jgi:hypothetical protein
VVRILDESVLDQHEFEAAQVQLIDWGVVYKTYADATH